MVGETHLVLISMYYMFCVYLDFVFQNFVLKLLSRLFELMHLFGGLNFKIILTIPKKIHF